MCRSGRWKSPRSRARTSFCRSNHVDAAYGPLKVLHDVNIKVPRGRTVAVVGESGSGKSTTARVITGLLPPSAGSVIFNGEPLPAALKDRSKDQLQKIQMIYQMADTAMNPRQTVEEIIGRPLEFYLGLTGKAREARAIELLEMIELDESFMDRVALRALGRPETAHLHRPRACRKPGSHHL